MDGGGGWGLFIGILGTVGGAIAAVWAWYRTQRKELLTEDEERQKRKREDEDRELSQRAMPFRLLYEQTILQHAETLRELRSEIATGQAGFRQLQADHANCQVTLARQEERVKSLEADLTDLRQQLGQPRRAPESQQQP